MSNIYLRPWQVEDAAWYVAARDEEIFRWTTEKRDLTVAETEEAIRKVNRQEGMCCFAIVDGQTHRLLGNIALTRDPPDSATAEVMYWLAPEGRGRGIASEAVKCLSEWAFQSLPLERILLKTMRENLRSQRVAERAGYRRIEVQPPDPDYIWFERK